MGCAAVIAGTGLAAAAVASRLIDVGCNVSLLHRSAPSLPGAEILPPEAQAQIEALGWNEVFDHAGAVVIEGFENHWDDDVSVVKPGPFLHVERTALARSALNFVKTRGVTVHEVRRLPRLEAGNTEVVRLELDGVERRFDVAIDATGRAAAWSRPVHRLGCDVADVFQGSSGSSPLRGRVVSDAARECWAYRAGLVGSTTVGIVARGRSRQELDPALARSLGVSAVTFRFVGRRPSFMQWAAEPAAGRRLAIGDAAFASNPLAGQGLRFAMASALAAAAAVDGLVRSNNQALALEYYRDFVNSVRSRHQSAIAAIRDRPELRPAATRIPDFLRFTAPSRLAALNVGGRLAPDVAYELPDGGFVRWIGGFDLRLLARLAHDPVPSQELSNQLIAEGLSARDTDLLMAFCISRGLLS